MARRFLVEGVALARFGVGLRRMRRLDVEAEFRDFGDTILFAEVNSAF